MTAQAVAVAAGCPVGTGRTLFRKWLPRAQASAEVGGWRVVAPLLPVPALADRISCADGDVLVYEDVFAEGRCQLLLGDLIALADRNTALVPQVEQLIDGICRDWCTAAARTGQVRELAATVPHLYADRMRPGGRIESWYLCHDVPVHHGPGHVLTLRDLAGYELAIGDRGYRLDIAQLVRDMRATLAPGNRWMTAVTQGDPTEPNIACPRCWLDFEHSGRNTLAGEIANVLWYLLGLGGWLVPRYQPRVYTKTLRLALPPVAVPQVTYVDVSHRTRRITLSYSWPAGAGRRAAIMRLVTWIRGELGTAAQLPSQQPMSQLRGFLAARLLGVIPPITLTPADALLIAAKLAESQDSATSLSAFTRTTPIPGNVNQTCKEHQ